MNFREFPLCEVGELSGQFQIFTSSSQICGVLSQVPNACIAPMAEYPPNSARFVIVVYVDELRIVCQQLPAYIATPAATLQESPIFLGLHAVAATYGSLARLLTFLSCILVFSAALLSADLTVGIQTVARAQEFAKLARGFALSTIRTNLMRGDCSPPLLCRSLLARPSLAPRPLVNE